MLLQKTFRDLEGVSALFFCNPNNAVISITTIINQKLPYTMRTRVSLIFRRFFTHIFQGLKTIIFHGIFGIQGRLTRRHSHKSMDPWSNDWWILWHFQVPPTPSRVTAASRMEACQFWTEHL